MKFLQNRHCAESLMFWLAAEEFRNIDASNSRKLKKKSEHIWHKYLEASASFEINIPFEQRQCAKQFLSKPHPEMFVAAQKCVFLLMVHGTFDYFLKSERYRAFKGTSPFVYTEEP